MNAEQKKIALECIRLWGSEDLSDCSGDQMAALLQELVDAPEPEPVMWKIFDEEWEEETTLAKVAEQYKKEGHTVIAYYTAPPAPSVPDGWRSSIAKEFPLYDEDGIDEDKHCCEWVMLQERKRLHKVIAAPTPAPEPEPVARVTGYYGGYLSIATVDGRVLPAGTALYTAPPAPSVPPVRSTGQWESSRIADYNRGWNDCREATEKALNDLEKRK